MRIKIKQRSFFTRLLDLLMIPVMYLLQFPSLEKPQETHRWNNHHIRAFDINGIDVSMVVRVDGGPEDTYRWRFGLPIFHMPAFGGWRRFIVLIPSIEQDEWYVGWVANDFMGVSRIPLSGPVRLLVKGGQTLFFGINEHGDQIKIEQIGMGQIGEKHSYRNVPLR